MNPHMQTNANTFPSNKLLVTHGLGVGFGERVILSEVDLEVPERGVVVLMGPAGTGKSTLLRTLAGLSAANPTFRSWGTVTYQGEPLGDQPVPALVGQSARLMMSTVFENLVCNLPDRRKLTKAQQGLIALDLLEQAKLPELVDLLEEQVVQLPLALQRHLAVIRLVVTDPALLCVDEPTTGLSDAESERLLTHLREEAKRRAILVVLHNQKQARFIGGELILLAGGRVQEQQSIPQFLDAPCSKVAQDFIRSGICTVASPDAKVEEIDELIDPPPPLPEAALDYTSDALGPRGFMWLKKGILAGTPQPGVVLDVDYDMKALKRVGVTKLITLTETDLDQDLLSSYEISNIWEPMPDMFPPSLAQGIRLCESIHRLIMQGEVVAVHCRAGHGRTGTLLALYLIWEGQSAMQALENVRRIEPRWIQSKVQEDFLIEFAAAIANHAPSI
ncbi:MAG: ATP-binding cassette domain-containing protein [Gallionellaceae bacterium]|jgi:atypical dual specificity phosphatase